MRYRQNIGVNVGFFGAIIKFIAQFALIAGVKF